MFQSDNIIDWAMIAQQWIQMQSVGGGGGNISAPPPPSISGSMQFPSAPMNMNAFTAQMPISIRKSSEMTVEEEKGEADMVMSNDEDDDEDVRSELKECGSGGRKVEPPPPLIRLPEESAAVMQSMQPSQWFMHQTLPALTIGATGIEERDATTTSGADGVAAWGAWPGNMSSPPVALVATPVQSTPNPTAHIPSLMKLSVANPNRSSNVIPQNDHIPEPEEPVTSSNMDAAKRKMLPAWIREGLEKMERAKQKEREQHEAYTKLEEETPSSQLSPHKVTVTSNTVLHSPSDSSGNEEDDDAVIDGKGASTSESVNRRNIGMNANRHNPVKGSRISATTKMTAATTKTTVRDEETDSDIDGIDATCSERSGVDIAGSSKVLELSGKSYEQRLSDLMIVVRRTLTELLLEVTNEEISQLANEALKSYKKKASSSVSVMIRNSALSSITGKLGLAAYADTSSSEESDEDNVDSNDADSLKFAGNEPCIDSEEELKATIKSRRRAWTKISEEIEERLVSLAEREERQLKHYAQMEQQREDEPNLSSGSTVGKSYERDFGETTETKLSHSNGKRQKGSDRKERTSRFSDNKDSNSSVNSLTYLTQHIQQHHNKQQQSQTLPANVPLFPSIQAGLNYNQSSAKCANSNTTIATSVTEASNLHKQTNRSKCSPSSLESARQGKKQHDREKERRRRHTSKHKHRSRIADSSHKGRNSGSSVSTSTSSSTLSSTSASSRTSNDTDGDSSSSSASISNVKVKKRKRHRSRSRNRSDKERHNQRHHHYSRDHQHSSQRLNSQTSSRLEKSERFSDEYSKSKHSSRDRRHHHQRRHHRRGSSNSDEQSRSRSRSHSSYTSSRHHRR